MLRVLKTAATELFQPALKSFNDGFAQQTRNTFILKRRWPQKLHQKNQKPDKLRGRHFVYDLIEDTCMRPKPNLSVVLTTFAEGFGQKGDVVSVKNRLAYNELLLPGRAVYDTPENRNKYKRVESEEDEKVKRSSPFVDRTINVLEKMVFALVMNKDQPWTVEPWHIRVALRKVHIHVPEEAIELPPEPIKGPDMTKQNKEFTVVITINDREKANVRFRLHHWATDPSERLPYVVDHWKQLAEQLFATQRTADDGRKV